MFKELISIIALESCSQPVKCCLTSASIAARDTAQQHSIEPGSQIRGHTYRLSRLFAREALQVDADAVRTPLGGFGCIGSRRRHDQYWDSTAAALLCLRGSDDLFRKIRSLHRSRHHRCMNPPPAISWCSSTIRIKLDRSGQYVFDGRAVASCHDLTKQIMISVLLSDASFLLRMPSRLAGLLCTHPKLRWERFVGTPGV